MRSARTPPSTFLLLPIRLSNSGGNLSVAAASTSQGLGHWSASTRAHTLTEAETLSSRSCDQGADLPGDEKATRVRCSVAAPPSMAVYRGKAFRVSTRFFEKTSSNTEVPDAAAEMGAGALWNRVPCRKAIGALAGAGGSVRWRALLEIASDIHAARRARPGSALSAISSTAHAARRSRRGSRGGSKRGIPGEPGAPGRTAPRFAGGRAGRRRARCRISRSLRDPSEALEVGLEETIAVWIDTAASVSTSARPLRQRGSASAPVR